NFLKTGSNKADINGDGIVNVFDFSILSQNFLKSCSGGGTPTPTATSGVTSTPRPTPTPTTTTTSTPTPTPITDVGSGNGIWISKEEVMSLPTSGTAWNNLMSAAQKSTSNPSFADQDSQNDVYTVAKALVYLRTG